MRFSPDGKRVIFESDRGGGTQIWVQDFDTSAGALTGDAKKVTTISTEASGGMWSPDGKSVLFVSSVFPDCKDDACNKQRDEEQAKSKVKARTYDHLMFRHWTHYDDGKRSHLFIVPIDGGVARDLTPGDYDVPPFSLGGQDQYAFSPDGKEVAYTCNTDEVQATSTNSDVFVVPATGGSAKRITTNPGSDGTPIYSPDGKYIAYRSQFRGGYESDRFRLMLFERATGKITDLTPNFDRWVDAIAWSPDSKTIYLTAGNEGSFANLPSCGGSRESLAAGIGRWLQRQSDTDAGWQDTGIRHHVDLGAQRNLHCAVALPAVPDGRAAELLLRPRLPAVQVETTDASERRSSVQGGDGTDGVVLVHRGSRKKKCRVFCCGRRASTTIRSIR